MLVCTDLELNEVARLDVTRLDALEASGGRPQESSGGMKIHSQLLILHQSIDGKTTQLTRMPRTSTCLPSDEHHSHRVSCTPTCAIDVMVLFVTLLTHALDCSMYRGKATPNSCASCTLVAISIKRWGGDLAKKPSKKSLSENVYPMICKGTTGRRLELFVCMPSSSLLPDPV